MRKPRHGRSARYLLALTSPYWEPVQYLLSVSIYHDFWFGLGTRRGPGTSHKEGFVSEHLEGSAQVPFPGVPLGP